jgi:hypothetical protein
MKRVKPLILAALPVVAAVAVWLLQTQAMFVLSKQYRQVGYIEYGWFNEPEGRVAALCIVWAPLLGSIAFFLGYGRLASQAAVASCCDWLTPLVWPLSGFIIIVLAVRTLLLSVQGYALIFI